MDNKIFFHLLNKKLIASIEKGETKCYDLGYGDMGFSLYFHGLSRLTGEKAYQRRAKKLLDSVFEGINTIQTIDIKTGLAGIGLGVDFLIRNNYVKGNVNTVLGDIDDFIFKQLSFPKHYESLDAQTMIEALYYFSVRLEAQKKGSETEYLFKEIIIKTINNAYLKLEKTRLNGRLVYDAAYELPLFMYVLSKIFRLKFYGVRIVNILKELSPTVLSIIPALHANRLYLLWGMSVVRKQIEIEGWNEHIQVLKETIDFDKIVNSELCNQNVYFGDGATSLFLLADKLRKEFSADEIDRFQQHLLLKITRSDVWRLMEDDDPVYFEEHKGLYNGFCGIAFLFEKNEMIINR
jgi:hypothetical protein